ncbi:biosynthetic peptidoglycan transglycosylase [Myroides fluvii]|uniref:biosynthetic peptidoglycan transglycosylase n=1 Tax=Myroides fluvii TaxID=2572594 RepID=UPI00131DD7FE|nr:biosynthetic peptidoglycan transglycosylase [Myroides fluvii]
MDSKGEQYFPTYKFDEKSRDVLLKEFEEAQKIANTQTQAYAQVTNLILLAFAIIIPLFISKEKYSIDIKEYSLIFVFVIFIFGAILLRYFIEVQKQIIFNARKVITLRLMLGIDYGHINLTLPNWRVEGATNPFAIKFFAGWLNFRSTPFWILTIALNILFASSIEMKDFSFTIMYISKFFNINQEIKIPWYFGNCIITFIYYYVFRKNLVDRHENLYLIYIKKLANIFKLKAFLDTEYILYRAKLSVIELQRLNIDYNSMYEILKVIEDHNYDKHNGVDFKALVRGALSQFKVYRSYHNNKVKAIMVKSGGSTITMQLTRTLFIQTRQNALKRKIFEILFSFWLNKQFSKKEILDFYIASVRFENKILGLANAIKFFFGDISKLTNEECFVLVERLSNVSSTFKEERIKFLIAKLEKKNIVLNKKNIYAIYSSLEKDNKIKKI